MSGFGNWFVNCNFSHKMSKEKKISLKFFIVIFVLTIIFMVSTFVGISLTINSESEVAHVLTTIEIQFDSTTSTTEGFLDFSSISPLLGCPYEIGWVGDGYCDDHTNSELCLYDGGDCCLYAITDDYCTDCICHQDGTRHPSKNSPKIPESTTYLLDSSLTFTTTASDDTYYYSDTTSGLNPYSNCEITLVSWIGDGVCDDHTNNQDCNFDGGDCCQNLDYFDHCIDCCCHQDGCLTHTTPFVTLCPTCNQYMLEYLGNMECNDYTNTEECCFDLGDCCDPNASKLPTSCLDCDCKENVWTIFTPTEPCEPESFISDGFCDDSHNFPICEFDGGDCCSSTSSHEFCSLCHCISPSNFTEPTNYPDKCHDLWIGDGVCDDVNNIQGCFYDEDDCCGDKGQTQFSYCTICQCIPLDTV